MRELEKQALLYFYNNVDLGNTVGFYNRPTLLSVRDFIQDVFDKELKKNRVFFKWQQYIHNDNYNKNFVVSCKRDAVFLIDSVDVFLQSAFRSLADAELNSVLKENRDDEMYRPNSEQYIINTLQKNYFLVFEKKDIFKIHIYDQINPEIVDKKTYDFLLQFLYYMILVMNNLEPKNFAVVILYNIIDAIKDEYNKILDFKS